MPRGSIRLIANLAFNLPPSVIPTRTFAMFRNRPAADLSSTLEDVPVTKLLLHVTRDKLRTHAMFPEVAANGWHV